MKKILLLFILSYLFSTQDLSSQNTSNFIVAVFNGDRISFEKARKTKKIEFSLKNLSKDYGTNFEHKAKHYLDFFKLNYSTLQENNFTKTHKFYSLTLYDENAIKMLNRLFVSCNIRWIEFEEKKMTREDFFKPYLFNNTISNIKE